MFNTARFAFVVRQLLYFNEPGLRELVIRDPQWLLDGVTAIVRQFDIHVLPGDAKAKRVVPEAWAALTQRGELRSELLPHLWGPHDRRFADPQAHAHLRKLMLKFGLLIPMRQPAARAAQQQRQGSSPIRLLLISYQDNHVLSSSS